MSTSTSLRSLVPGTPSRRSGPAAGVASSSLFTRDALWDGYHFVILAGPLEDVDAHHARRRLVECADQLQAVLGVRSQHRRRVPQGAAEVAELVERLVVEDPLLDGHPDQVARVLADPLGGLPFRLSVGRAHVAIHVDHVVGDGTAMYEVAPWLVSLACAAEPRPVPSTPSSPSPHLTALRHTLDRTSLPRALRLTAAQVLTERRAQASPPPPKWDRRQSVESVVDPRGTAEALKAFRQAHAKGLSNGMVLMAALWFALVEHGAVSPELRPGIGVDLRRYLPRRTPVFGNFSTCVRLPPGTARYPVDLRDALEAEAATAVPLLAASAQCAVAGLRAPLRRTRPGAATGGGHHGASLVLNHLGKPAGWEKLPWQQGVQRVLINAPSVDSSRAVTVNVVEMSDGPHIAASFFESVVPRAAVRGALEDVTHRLDDVLREVHRRR